ncbi:MAG: hypothetical protein ABI910_23075, partial [Gemmatimonadota bacterium]
MIANFRFLTACRRIHSCLLILAVGFPIAPLAPLAPLAAQTTAPVTGAAARTAARIYREGHEGAILTDFAELLS